MMLELYKPSRLSRYQWYERHSKLSPIFEIFTLDLSNPRLAGIQNCLTVPDPSKTWTYLDPTVLPARAFDCRRLSSRKRAGCQRSARPLKAHALQVPCRAQPSIAIFWSAWRVHEALRLSPSAATSPDVRHLVRTATEMLKSKRERDETVACALQL